MTPFLTYELLTPETADPVILRITGQRERGFPKLICDNGIAIISKSNPEYDAPFLFVWGEDEADDADLVYIPLTDWPAVKQAIRELNEHYKEKDMSLKSEGERILNILKSSIEPTGDTYRDVVRLIENSLAENERLLNLYQQAVKGRQDFRNAYRKEKDRKSDRENISMKEDRYEFPASEWKHDVEYDIRQVKGGELHDPKKIILTRKKPKVVVEWRSAPSIYRSGAAYEQDDYGQFYIVQFRVTGFAWNEYLEWIRCDGHLAEVSILLTRQRTVSSFNPSHCKNQRHFLYIGLDARDKWSTPVLLPESVYTRLDEICGALESEANGGKG